MPGFVFGPLLGYAGLALATLMMLLGAVLTSSSPVDAVPEVLIVAVAAGTGLLWFRGRLRERQRRLLVRDSLDSARQELAFHVELLQRSERRLSTISEVCRTITETPELPLLLQRVAEKVVQEMGCEAAMISLITPSGQTMELGAHLGISERLASSLAVMKAVDVASSSVVEPPWAGMETSSGRRAVVSAALVEEGIHSQLVAPIRSRARPIGILWVATRAVRRFSTEEEELLTAVGRQIGMAIENARLCHEIRFSEEKYRDFFENATVAILLEDLEGTVIDANKACATLTGYPRDGLIGMKLSRLLLDRSLEVMAEVERNLRAGEPTDQPYEVRISRRGAGDAILSLTTRLVTHEGRPAAFQHIALDITERRQMQENLTYYMREILTAQEEERKRVARDLHDGAVQSLLLVLQRMEATVTSCGAELPPTARAELETLRNHVLDTLAEIRRLTRDLRPQILDDMGLVAAVEWLAEEVEAQGGASITVTVRGLPRRLPPEVQLMLFRIAQEALNNVRRHSLASAAGVSIQYEAEGVDLVVRDNGRGFVVPRSLSSMAAEGRLGLLGMSERARLAGGSLTIESTPGEGTRVTAHVPA